MTALAVSHARAFDEGLTRSARLMRTLGPDGAPIWDELSAEETRALTAAMDALTDDLDEAEQVAAAFADAAAATPVAGRAANGIWTRLSALDTDALVAMTAREHPQMVAFIMSRINGDAAARLMKALPPAVAIDAMQRLLNLGSVHPITTRTLAERLTALMADMAPVGAEGGHERVARIFDRLDSRSEKAMLAALESAQPGAGEKVRALMFTFDDLTGLDAGGMQTLLSNADRAVLVIALKGAREDTAEAFFANMTKRAGDLLKDEIDAQGAVRRSEVDAARQELVALARSLIHRGDIRVTGAATDDELVE